MYRNDVFHYHGRPTFSQKRSKTFSFFDYSIKNIAGTMAKTALLYNTMSEQNSTITSGPGASLLNPMLSYLDIVSLLARDAELDKFNSIMATTSLKNIADAIAAVFEEILDFKPQLEVMVSMDQKIVFREDWTYFTEIDGAIQPFNPFTEEKTPGDVHCIQRPTLHYTATHLNHAWSNGSFDYTYTLNPKFFQLVADFLNVYLNEEQPWTRFHAKPSAHFLQAYLNLDKTVSLKVPELSKELQDLQLEIGSAQSAFRLGFGRENMTREEAFRLYEISGVQYENSITQDFWDRHQVRYVLRELTVMMTRIINRLFPAVLGLTERSVRSAHGYDVFYAYVMNDNQVNVSSIGDYRILHWELMK